MNRRPPLERQCPNPAPEARSQQNLFDRSWGYGRIYHPPDGSLPVGLESGSLVRPQLYQNVKSNTVRQGLRHDNPEMTAGSRSRGGGAGRRVPAGRRCEGNIRNEIQVVQGVASPRHDPAMVPTDKSMRVLNSYVAMAAVRSSEIKSGRTARMISSPSG